MLTPREVKERAIIGETKLAHVVDDEIFESGVVEEMTPSGMTIKTDTGHVFKWRWKKEKYALKGNPDTRMMLVGRKAHRA